MLLFKGIFYSTMRYGFNLSFCLWMNLICKFEVTGLNVSPLCKEKGNTFHVGSIIRLRSGLYIAHYVEHLSFMRNSFIVGIFARCHIRWNTIALRTNWQHQVDDNVDVAKLYAKIISVTLRMRLLLGKGSNDVNSAYFRSQLEASRV